jgi:hypothetical protein
VNEKAASRTLFPRRSLLSTTATVPTTDATCHFTFHRAVVWCWLVAGVVALLCGGTSSPAHPAVWDDDGWRSTDA